MEQVPLLSADEMRRWDRRAVESAGVPERVLMESAGRAAARIVHRLHPGGRVAALIGAGNNGGDALIVLRTLRARGREVVAIDAGAVHPRADLLHGWEVDWAPAEEAEPALSGAAAVVDGILGTGALGAPRPTLAALIRTVNASGVPVVALDGPSGVDLTTGETPGEAIRARATVTFGAPKRGLLLYPGRVHAGRILAVDVGFPPLDSSETGATIVTPAWARAHLPSVPPNAHKGTLGTVTVLAGHPGMAGAAVLVGMGAARAGAGKVRLVSPGVNRAILQMGIPEALFVDRDGDDLDSVFRDADAIVAGPGMGTDEAALAALKTLLRSGESPLLLDADALTLVARAPDLLRGVARPLLLTPHPGEMARLLGREMGDILADPFGIAAEAVERFGCAVLLKGAPSLVAQTGCPTRVNAAGHSGIATGGMGDTLAGIAGSLLAVGSSPQEAGALALFLSGRAAEIAGRGRSLLPRDVAEALPRAFSDVQCSYEPDEPGVLLDLAVPR